MKRSLLTILTTLLLVFSFAQVVKNAIILKMNGEELAGKVLEISDDEVKFAYTGETLVYKIKKSDILKITFASGRMEIITKQPLPSETKSGNATSVPSTSSGPGLADHHNKVAILPFAFLKDGEPAADEISMKVQNETFSFMSRHSGIMTILDPRTTNALLIKAGINKESISQERKSFWNMQETPIK